MLLKHKRIVLYFNYAKIIKNIKELLKYTNLYQMHGRCKILESLCILKIKNYAYEIIYIVNMYARSKDLESVSGFASEFITGTASDPKPPCCFRHSPASHNFKYRKNETRKS